MVVRCCFCGDEIFEEDPGLVTLVAVEVPRSGRTQARSQQLWCHPRCLGVRLHKSAVFNAASFEVEDAATVDEEDRSEESAHAACRGRRLAEPRRRTIRTALTDTETATTQKLRGPTLINVGSGHRRGTRRAPRRTHATSRDHTSGTWVHACGGLWPASAASSRRRCRNGCNGTGRWARFRRPLDEACHAVRSMSAAHSVRLQIVADRAPFVVLFAVCLPTQVAIAAGAVAEINH